VQAILFRVPRFWRGFRAMATGLKLSHQQIRRWWRETDYIWVGRLRGNCIWVCLECSWIVRSKRETERLPRVFWEAAIHHQCSKLNCHMQDLTLFLTTKSAAAAPPPHGEEEGRPGGVYCYVSVCTRNSTLPKKTTSFAVHRTSTQSALDGNGGGTQRSRKW
jgi:hypothetical protein